jgi:hypothetical protein
MLVVPASDNIVQHFLALSTLRDGLTVTLIG